SKDGGRRWRSCTSNLTVGCWLLVSDGRGTVPVFTATKQIKENILLQILCSFRNMSLLCTNFEIDNESTRNKK
ncbi:hypothetical protein KSZ02_17220, partial [Bacteroides thetaiotaomicron]